MIKEENKDKKRNVAFHRLLLCLIESWQEKVDGTYSASTAFLPDQGRSPRFTEPWAGWIWRVPVPTHCTLEEPFCDPPTLEGFGSLLEHSLASSMHLLHFVHAKAAT